jgi:hypothetical protein
MRDDSGDLYAFVSWGEGVGCSARPARVRIPRPETGRADSPPSLRRQEEGILHRRVPTARSRSQRAAWPAGSMSTAASSSRRRCSRQVTCMASPPGACSPATAAVAPLRRRRHDYRLPYGCSGAQPLRLPPGTSPLQVPLRGSALRARNAMVLVLTPQTQTIRPHIAFSAPQPFGDVAPLVHRQPDDPYSVVSRHTAPTFIDSI